MSEEESLITASYNLLDSRINRLEKLIYLVLITSAPNVLNFVNSLG